jgi:hypothetical protein
MAVSITLQIYYNSMAVSVTGYWLSTVLSHLLITISPFWYPILCLHFFYLQK